jgi:hypothetical protein
MQLTTETEYINSTNKWSDVVLEPFKNIIYKWWYMFSLASVKEKNGVITVSYVHRESIQADIKRIFKTSRVNTYMFLDAGRYSFAYIASLH